MDVLFLQNFVNLGEIRRNNRVIAFPVRQRALHIRARRFAASLDGLRRQFDRTASEFRVCSIADADRPEHELAQTECERARYVRRWVFSNRLCCRGSLLICSPTFPLQLAYAATLLVQFICTLADSAFRFGLSAFLRFAQSRMSEGNEASWEHLCM